MSGSRPSTAEKARREQADAQHRKQCGNDKPVHTAIGPDGEADNQNQSEYHVPVRRKPLEPPEYDYDHDSKRKCYGDGRPEVAGNERIMGGQIHMFAY